MLIYLFVNYVLMCLMFTAIIIRIITNESELYHDTEKKQELIIFLSFILYGTGKSITPFVQINLRHL